MPATSQYQIPPYGSDASRVLNWCLEAEAEGRAWLEAQTPARGWPSALQTLSETQGGDSPSGLSNVGYNKTKRGARELVASLSNFRHEGEYKPVWDQSLYDVASTLTNLDQNWYRSCRANEAHRAGLQYGVSTGTGYWLETWDKHFHSPYRGDIRLSAISPEDVYCVQLPKDHNLQRAYAVIIREELPINLAKAIYAETNLAFASALTPDRDSPSQSWLSKGLKKVQQYVAPALRVAGRTQKGEELTSPTVDIFHMYVMDRTVNEGPFPITIGTLGTNWSYTVPALGDPLPTEIVNPATGNFFTVPAAPEHCRLFPLRRFVMFSRTGVGYDGSSPWWHGAVPLARVRFNDWPWESLGGSLVGEAKTMQDGIVALMRGIEDAAAARLDPAMAVDDRVAKTFGEAFNPRKAGARGFIDMTNIPDPFKLMLPPGYYDVPPWIPDWINQQERRIDYQMGTADMVAIAKAQQIPGADTLEKLFEMAGPIVQDLVRQVEEPLRQLGEWRKAYYFQFYTKARMITITGPEGVDIDVAYKPEQLRMIKGLSMPDQRNPRTIEKSLDEFFYHVSESGINEINRMTKQLLFIQLKKANAPISWWTILSKVCRVPNYGPPPAGTNNEIERWVAEQRMQIELAVEQQQLAAQSLGGPMAGVAPSAGAAGGNGATSPSGDAGRPPSFKESPKIQSKDGGARSTITTS